MRRSAVGLLTVAAVVIAAVAALAVAGDEEVELEQLPPQVRKAVLKAARGGTIHEIEREREHGRVVYEVEVRFGRREVEFTFDEHGTLLEKQGEYEEHEEGQADGHEDEEEEHEQMVAARDVPAKALTALRKLAGGARILHYELEREHGRRYYEAEWNNAAGRKIEATVTADGDLIVLEEELAGKDVPAAVRAAARKLAGEARVEFEKNTLILYEIEYRSDGRRHEVLLLADGRQIEIEAADHEEHHEDHDEDEDEDDG